jgi:phosphomethylpyrimidine synthase
MKITQDVRDYAAKLNEQQTGMEEMAKKFREGGGKIYAPVSEAVKKSIRAL